MKIGIRDALYFLVTFVVFSLAFGFVIPPLVSAKSTILVLFGVILMVLVFYVLYVLYRMWSTGKNLSSDTFKDQIEGDFDNLPWSK